MPPKSRDVDKKLEIMPGCFPFFKSGKRSVSRAEEAEKVNPRMQSMVSQNKASSCACAFPSTATISHDATSVPPAYADIYHKSDALSTISTTVDELSDSLRKVSLQMHGNPEIRWEEHKTMKLLSDFMEKQGWKVKRGAYGVETGFEAVFQHGQGGKVIGFNSEVGTRAFTFCDTTLIPC